MNGVRPETLELLGAGHLADALRAEIEAHGKREAFAVYVTDALSAIAGQLGVKFSLRFREILHPETLDARTADEIAADVFTRAGLNFGE